MFRIVVLPKAAVQIARLRRLDAVAILNSIETHFRFEPERTSRSSIKRLRGRQDATYRLRAGQHRVFYDVQGRQVAVVAVLHKSETHAFYRRSEP